MTRLEKIHGLSKTSLKLLRKSGVSCLEELAAQDVDQLAAELRKTNQVLRLVKRTPNKASVSKWIAQATQVLSEEPATEENAALPSLEQGDEIEPSSAEPEPPSFPKLSALPNRGDSLRIPALKSASSDQRISLIRSPRTETNLGKNPKSRRYIRGVLHRDPLSIRLGAIFSLLLFATLPLAIIPTFLLLALVLNPTMFAWVPGWLLVFPVALVLCFIGYLLWGVSGKCIVCRQKLFVSKAALKHIKAHRIPGFGFVAPLSVHLLAFHWFRCSSCGTPIRLKK